MVSFFMEFFQIQQENDILLYEKHQNLKTFKMFYTDSF